MGLEKLMTETILLLYIRVNTLPRSNTLKKIRKSLIKASSITKSLEKKEEEKVRPVIPKILQNREKNNKIVL